MIELIRTMSSAERKHWANFILTYPDSEMIKLDAEQKADLSQVHLPGSVTCQELKRVLRTSEPSPFSVEPPPLPPGATASPLVPGLINAPTFAGAEALTTAPEDRPGITGSEIAMNVLSQNAALSEQTAGGVAPQGANLVQLDSEGLPWDARIHTPAKTKVANGTWKLKRGADPTEVSTVRDELKGLMAIPAASPEVTVVTSESRLDFIGFIDVISQLVKNRKITGAEITQCCVNAGIAAPNLLATRPDLIQQVVSGIDAIIADRL